KRVSRLLATSLLAAGSFSLCGFASAAPIGTGLALKDAAASDSALVRVAYVGRGGRAGVAGGRVGVAGGRVGVAGGRYVGAGGYAGGGWRHPVLGYGVRPGYGLAAGAAVGGALAAGSYYNNYNNYGYDNSYAADYGSSDYAYSPGYYNSNINCSGYYNHG